MKIAKIIKEIKLLEDSMSIHINTLESSLQDLIKDKEKLKKFIKYLEECQN